VASQRSARADQRAPRSCDPGYRVDSTLPITATPSAPPICNANGVGGRSDPGVAPGTAPRTELVPSAAGGRPRDRSAAKPVRNPYRSRRPADTAEFTTGRPRWPHAAGTVSLTPMKARIGDNGAAHDEHGGNGEDPQPSLESEYPRSNCSSCVWRNSPPKKPEGPKALARHGDGEPAIREETGASSSGGDCGPPKRRRRPGRRSWPGRRRSRLRMPSLRSDPR